MTEHVKQAVLSFQKNEITEYFIYSRLAKSEKNAGNSEVLKKIAADELRHYNIWKKYSQKDAAPDRLKVWKYFIITKVLGLTFGLKLMEGGEDSAVSAYKDIAGAIPEAAAIADEEGAHEMELVNMIDEDRLKYMGSVVLGLNDALVEFSGALAGLTFALQNTQLVATAGAIMGIAASLSMAASEFLSTKSEGSGKNPLKACVYTGIAYVMTVFLLILPYLLLKNLLLSLAFMLLAVVIIIYSFTFYISVAKDLNFHKRFAEMVSISLGVASLSFLIGLLVRHFMKIEV